MSRLRGIMSAALLAACTHGPLPASGTAAMPAPNVPVRQRAVLLPSSDSAVARMIDEGMQRSHVDADLQYLLDVIGPRLTGSAAAGRANAWTRKKFLEYGADRAELEPWTFGVGWTRGPMTVRMLEPQQRELIGASWAWSPGTRGPVAGDVVLMDARTHAEFDRRFAGKLRGAWVMLGAAAPIVNPADPPVTHADSVRVDSVVRAFAPHTDDEREFSNYKFAYVVQEGVAGVIRDGGKQFGLLSMSGSPGFISPIPQFVIGNDNYAQLDRLIRRGEHVRIEADIANTFTRDTLKSFNTVAELRGSEKPDEVVILGAHLDSWDLATGGTDNGAGAIAVLEAARIIKASGVPLKRTIRFVLFTGEEEGLYGSQAYAAAHKSELDKVQAVLVLDNGTGRITGMALQGRDELRDLWTSMFRPLEELDTLRVRSGRKTGTDHLSFLTYGVPAFNYDQLSRGYDLTHHSQVDNYSFIVPGDVAQAATVMAVNAWQLSQLDGLLPRGPKQ